MTTHPTTHFEQLVPAMVADIGILVSCESPSSDLEAVAASARVVADIGHRVLGELPAVITEGGVTHLCWRRGRGDGQRVLLLAHHDTVWPVGTLDRLPFKNEDGVVRGPGSFDMKTGIVMAMHAIAALPPDVPVTLLVTGDEEIGSRHSRELIETTARGCAVALVLEAAAPGGALKTARKGVSDYEITIRGRASHAGLEPDKGTNAAVEAAHQVLALTKIADPGAGTTVVPTVVAAGTTTNTVPAAATIAVDVRAWTVAEQNRVHEAILGLRTTNPDASIVVSGGPNRPPLEPSSAADLFAKAQQIAAELSLPELTEAQVGGGSDGNLTAGVGVPTLDGLGAVGDGAHAEHEHVIVAEIGPRTALLSALVAAYATA